MKKVTEIVTELAGPIAERYGCGLWDVEYVKEGGDWYLRIYIDAEDGVTIEQCEQVSRAIDPLLDGADPIPDSYILEVSSAGLERVLKRPGDFARFIGYLVEVRLYKPREGVKQFVGTLEEYAGGDVRISCGGRPVTFEKAEIAQVRLKMV